MKKKLITFKNNALNTVGRFTTHPQVRNFSKVAKSGLDIASKLGQAKITGPLAATGAAISLFDSVAEHFNVRPESAVRKFIRENKLVSTNSGLGRMLAQYTRPDRMVIQVFAKGSSGNDELVGIRLDDKILAFCMRNGEAFSTCYYTKGFDFKHLTDVIWEGIGAAANFTWNHDWESLEIEPAQLRGCPYVGQQHKPAMMFKDIQEYRRRGMSYGSLLYGPPGTGKTSFVEELARLDGGRMVVASPSATELLSGHSKSLLIALQPNILLLDDIHLVRNVGTVLSFVEDVRAFIPHMAVISTCNRFPEIKALMRPGRLGELVHFASPSLEDRITLFDTYLEQYGADRSQLNIEELANQTEHRLFSHDYIRFVCEKACFMDQNRLLKLISDLKAQMNTYGDGV